MVSLEVCRSMFCWVTDSYVGQQANGFVAQGAALNGTPPPGGSGSMVQSMGPSDGSLASFPWRSSGPSYF